MCVVVNFHSTSKSSFDDLSLSLSIRGFWTLFKTVFKFSKEINWHILDVQQMLHGTLLKMGKFK